MTMFQATYILISLCIGGLGIFVFLKDPRNSINKRFFLYTLVIAVWVFSINLTLLAKDTTIATSRLRIVFSVASLMGPSFFFFSSVFPDRKERTFQRYLCLLFFAASIIFICTSPSLVKKSAFEGDKIRAEYGSLFILFWIHLLSCMGYSFYILYKKIRWAYGVTRLQIQYVFFGIVLFVLCAFITNFLFPLFGLWQAEQYVPLTAIPIPIMIAIAIVKYHLMDITVVLRKSTMYAVLTVVLSFIYIFVWVIVGNLLKIPEYKEAVTAVVSTSVMVFTFVLTGESIQYFVEKTLFRTKYSSSKILSDSTAILSSIHDLPGLLHSAIQYLYDSVGMEKISVFLRDETHSHYTLRASIKFPIDAKSIIHCDNAIATRLSQNKTVLSLDQLKRFHRRKSDVLLIDVLEQLDVDSCIPLVQGNDLIGFIFLGKKINKKVYTLDDIQMFIAFSGQMALAVRNAHLYLGLKESMVYRDNILESLRSGVIVIDYNEEVTLINYEAKKIIGKKNMQSSKTILAALGKDTYRLLRYTLKNDTEFKNVETTIKKGDEINLYSVTTTQLKTETGEKLGALMILTDLTELKMLQAEKQHSERLAYLGTLAANIAHEIRNPLVPINTYFQLLPQKKGDEKFHTEFRTLALNEIGRINRIIEEMLDLAKPSNPILQPINPHRVIMETIKLLRDTVSEKDIEIVTELNEINCQLCADEDKVRQVMVNILQNSIEILPKNGHIQVSTILIDGLSYFKKKAKKHPSSIFFSFVPSVLHDENKQFFVMKVSDNGKGISAEKMQYIFEPFFTDKNKGTGLGLAVVYRIVKDHEGCIYVESQEDKGTDFYICFPINQVNVYLFPADQEKTLESSHSL
ncbi:MAG: ATP-binding protein [Candidatus Brocadiaceae bacterium]|nr:ATP-binding protein [Candidatus Brocadiaceae bacterium]